MGLQWDQRHYYIHRSLNNYLNRGIYFGSRGENDTWISQISQASNDIITNALKKTKAVPENTLQQLSHFGSEVLSAASVGAPTAEIQEIWKMVEDKVNAELDNGEKLLDRYSVSEDRSGLINKTTMTGNDDKRYNAFIKMREALYKIQADFGGSKKQYSIAALQTQEANIRTLAGEYETALRGENNFLSDIKQKLLAKKPSSDRIDDIWKWMKLGLGYPSTSLQQGNLGELVAAYAALQLSNAKEKGLKGFEKIMQNDPKFAVRITGSQPTNKTFDETVVLKNGDITIQTKTIQSQNKADVTIILEDKSQLGISVKNVAFNSMDSKWVNFVSAGNVHNIFGPELFFHLVQLYAKGSSSQKMKGIEAKRKQAYSYFKKAVLAQALIGTDKDQASVLFINAIDTKTRKNGVKAIHIPTLIKKFLENEEMLEQTSVKIDGKSLSGKGVLFSPSYTKNKDPQIEMQQRVAAAIQSAQDATVSHSIALAALGF